MSNATGTNDSYDAYGRRGDLLLLGLLTTLVMGISIAAAAYLIWRVV